MNKNEYYQLLQLGFLRRILREREENKAKAGKLRGGNSGAIVNGRIIGGNPKETLLRYLGLELPGTFDQYLLFDDGYANEDLHNALLNEAGVTYKCEEEVPIKWEVTTDKGTVVEVVGRPDRILTDGDKLILLNEEKLIGSSFKAPKIAHWGEGSPGIYKPENIVQVGHYSWQKKFLPAVIIFTSRLWHSMKKPLDKLTMPDHRAIRHSGDFTWGIEPFMSLFDVTWTEDEFLVLDGKKTVLNPQAIIDYYTMIANCAEQGIIPDYHYSTVYGKPRNKKDVEKYYDWKHIPEDDFNEWVALIQAECDEAWAGVEEQLQELEELLA